ncbi:hypothetical protein F4677DRAFT_153191 [Hypoxylon crocopeplum]|nr:hypothetical protein F4677DRAFT_153191 [Hypoxylon crocopeplum]
MDLTRDVWTGLVTGKRIVDDGWTSDLDEEQFVATYLEDKYDRAPPFVADLNTEFLIDHEVPSANNDDDNGDSDYGDSEECANVGPKRLRTWRDMWRDMPQERLKKLIHRKSPFCNQIAQICSCAQVLVCSRPECIKARNDIDRLMPRCTWTNFRVLAVQCMACLVSFTGKHQKSSGCLHLYSLIKAFHLLIDAAKVRRTGLEEHLLGDRETKDKIDVFGMCEMIYWMLTVTHRLGFVAVLERRWSVDFLPAAITEPAVLRAAHDARRLGLCQNRFWNLAVAAERKHIDLPAVIESAANHRKLKHVKHEKCTSSFCRLNLLDSTKVTQLHKCGSSPSCDKKLTFDPELLNTSIVAGGRTVWTVRAPFRVSQTEPYIAISHVWSDGTGIGIQPVGEVNACLFDFLAGIVKSQGCSGIWWDTISIPSNPILRRKAINKMHDNYANAECTLLHDQYLVDFPWTDDGSPCIALVLSPWFTRGWTALELIMSQNVKVLFKDGNVGGGLVVKDLDDDILAHDPAECTRGHWVASTIIRRLRQPVHNATNLAAILKPRSTSWPRDRMVIAGLLANVGDIDYNLQSDEITKLIINSVYRINPSSLHHGQAPIANTEGWSWCPPSIYDMPSDTVGDLWQADEISHNTCMVDRHGVLVGFWHFRLLERKDTEGSLTPNSSHLEVVLSVRDSLRRWRYCLLLRDNKVNEGPALLVMPVGSDKDFIHCKFIGSVVETPSARTGVLDKRYDSKGFRIGYEDGRKTVLSRPLWEPQEDSDTDSGSSLDDHLYQWMSGRVWIGDQRPQGQILVTRYLEDENLTQGMALRFVHGTTGRTEMRTIRYPPIPLYTAMAGLAFSTEPVFTAGEGTDESSSEWVVESIVAQSTWPPPIIPAEDRACVAGFQVLEDASDDERESFDLFRLTKGSMTHTYAALDENLYAPSEETPYKGIWAGLSPKHEHQFLLFHQSRQDRLEVIKLTGDEGIPRGEVLISVEDLASTEIVDAGPEWGEVQGVVAKVQIPRKHPLLSSEFRKASLLLVSHDCVVMDLSSVAITPMAIELQRLELGSFLERDPDSRATSCTS